MTDNALAQAIGAWLYAKKAQDIIALNVSHLTVITDYMIIASGRTAAQVKALADEVDEKMAKAGLESSPQRGRDGGPLDCDGLRQYSGAYLPSGGTRLL